MGLPLLLMTCIAGALGAASAWGFSPNVPVLSELDLQDAWDAGVPIAVGVVAVSLLYALAYKLRLYQVLMICGLTAQIVTAFPGAQLAWLERHFRCFGASHAR